MFLLLEIKTGRHQKTEIQLKDKQNWQCIILLLFKLFITLFVTEVTYKKPHNYQNIDEDWK